jgi:hypothetical protein
MHYLFSRQIRRQGFAATLCSAVGTNFYGGLRQLPDLSFNTIFGFIEQTALPEILNRKPFASPSEDLVPQQPKFVFQYFGLAHQYAVILFEYPQLFGLFDDKRSKPFNICRQNGCFPSHNRENSSTQQ